MVRDATPTERTMPTSSNDAPTTTEEAAKTPTKPATKAGASFDVAALRVTLAKAVGVPKVSRPILAKLVGAHVNTVALWESGARIGEAYLVKLRDLDARIGKGEKIELAAKKKGGPPKKVAVAEKAKKRPTAKKPAKRPTAKKARPATKAKRAKSTAAKKARPAKVPTAKKPGRPKEAASAKAKTAPRFDVRALRTRLGASREVFAKLLGVSAGSILNWEQTKPITAKNVARLQELAAKAETGQVTLPERKTAGRPRKGAAASSSAAGGRAAVAITGEVATLYSNTLQVTRGELDARITFGLEVPGEGARAVVDVIVPASVIAGLRS
jgi:DNA-binding transcriptional regulator YiaG